MTNFVDISEDEIGAPLSTFKEYNFTIDGVFCRTMESFLQSLREKSPEKQIEICKLVARDARESFETPEWNGIEPLFWQGEPIERESNEYNLLINRAYELMSKNKRFDKALMATGEDILLNRCAKNDKHKTLLTEDEQCNILTAIRAGWEEERGLIKTPNYYS